MMSLNTQTSNSPLPTPRALLTTLINTLTLTPIPPPSRSNTTNQTYPSYSTTTTSPPTNPLKPLPTSHRALLATLHVLFPPPMLLQALDLLDRGLVTRLIEIPPVSPPTATLRSEPVVNAPPGHVHLHSSPSTTNQQQDTSTKTRPSRRNIIHQVQSSQPQKSRFKNATGSGLGGGNNVYVVHLESWNCSCAAFAFSAYPSLSSRNHAKNGNPPWSSLALSQEEDRSLHIGTGGERRNGVEREKEEETEREWEFGGLSFDGKEGGLNVPICKHLLACLLGERWGDLLGGFVSERIVGKEEMAGVGGDC